MTAPQALVDPDAQLKPGERVLVQGGAGAGAGLPCSWRPAWAATSPPPAATRTLGWFGPGRQGFGSADDLARQAAGEFDVVIDTVGGAVLDGSYDLLRPGGRLVTLSAPPDQDRAAQRDIRAVFFVVTADPAALSGLAKRAATRVASAPSSARCSRWPRDAALRERPALPAIGQDPPRRAVTRCILGPGVPLRPPGRRGTPCNRGLGGAGAVGVPEHPRALAVVVHLFQLGPLLQGVGGPPVPL